MKKKELRGHLGTLAFNMDSQWCVMHRQDVAESARLSAEASIRG